MPAPDGRPPAPLPLTSRDRRISAPMVAFLASLAWLGLVAAVMATLTRRGQGLPEATGLVAVGLAILLPVAMLWLSVLVLRAVAALNEQALRIEAALDALRRMRLSPAPPPAPAPPASAPDEAALTLFVSRRESRRAAAEAGPLPGQHGLALDPPRPMARPLDAAETIGALDLPRDAGDAAGFDLLRRALHDPGLAELIRAAQQVLSGLAAEGIEMRELSADRARPEVWRAFAQGARGPAVAALGGVRDRSVLALTGARMRADPAFREAAHRFLRAYDRRLAALEPEADDALLARLAETRSARAFMVLGRVTGMFG